MAWLLLSGYDPFASEAVRSSWSDLSELTHALRLHNTKDREHKPTREDTRFTVALSALALFGEAIAGPATFRAMGFGPDPKVERRFHKWFAALLSKHLAAG